MAAYRFRISASCLAGIQACYFLQFFYPSSVPYIDTSYIQPLYGNIFMKAKVALSKNFKNQPKNQ
jgi:hypothetical protein